MFRSGGAAVVGLVIVGMLAGCTNGGDGYAASLGERVIIAIGDDITPAYPQPRDAEFLAAWAIESPRLPHTEPQVDYTVETLDWAGDSGDEAGAIIQFRVGVHVYPQSATHVGDFGYTEGRSVRCWELTIFGYHDYDSLKQREITCPEGAEAKHPDPAPLPAFPDDVDTRLAQALEGATASTAEDRVREAFPEEFYTIAAEVRDGEVAVSLAIAAEFECAVGVVHADATVEVFRGFKKELLQPGEGGCTPTLYFAPIVTH